MKMINLKKILVLMNILIFLFSSVSLAKRKSRNTQYILNNKRHQMVENNNNLSFIEKNNNVIMEKMNSNVSKNEVVKSQIESTLKKDDSEKRKNFYYLTIENF